MSYRDVGGNEISVLLEYPTKRFSLLVSVWFDTTFDKVGTRCVCAVYPWLLKIQRSEKLCIRQFKGKMWKMLVNLKLLVLNYFWTMSTLLKMQISANGKEDVLREEAACCNCHVECQLRGMHGSGLH